MTKNKKQKSVVREIARTEGVSFTRAAMLDDRIMSNSSDILRENEMKFVLDTVEAWLGWELALPASTNILVHFDSDSPQSAVTTPLDIRHKKGIPHWAVSGGTQEQSFRFLDDIRMQINTTLGAYGTVLKRRNMDAQLSLMMDTYKMRLKAMTKARVDTFAELRIHSIEKYGPEQVQYAPSYAYLFIYDWNETMADASEETKDTVHYLMEHGKKTGIHIVVSVRDTDEYVRAWTGRGMTNWINVNDYEEPARAITKLKNDWLSISIPAGNLVYRDGVLVNPSMEP